jgi:hypothetical protein
MFQKQKQIAASENACKKEEGFFKSLWKFERGRTHAL